MFKSNERSEDSYIGLAVFFSGKSLKILSVVGIYALFEFNCNSSAESDVNSTLQLQTCNWRKKSSVFYV